MIGRRLASMLIAMASVALLCQAASAQLSSGVKAPDFTLTDLKGKDFKLSSCFVKPGKVVVLDLWATWCPPCRAEIPYLTELHKKYKDKGTVFVGVALDRYKDAVEEFVKEYRIKYTILHDPNGRKVVPLYRVRPIPQTYIIDRKGVIRYVHIGFNGREDALQMEKEIKKLLAEK